MLCPSLSVLIEQVAATGWQLDLIINWGCRMHIYIGVGFELVRV